MLIVLRPGTLRFTCGIGMYTGQLTIVEKQEAGS
jgi:hypothetical protein